MLARFRMNVQRHPKLFAAWLVGCVFAVAESYVPRLVGIDERHVQYVNIANFALALVLAGLVYRWVFSDARRVAIFLNIADLLEGREICTVAAHQTTNDDEDYEEESEPDDEPEPEDEEEEIL
jgi:hypothetical protein